MSITARANAINFTNILVATDLSRASLWSVPYVSAIARQYGSNIYIGHVLPLAIYTAARPQSFDVIEKECREHAQEKLDRYSAQIKEQRVGVQTLLTEGDVGIVIPDWVKQHHLDLVAVGTTGRSGVRKLFLGSTAEEIIRSADCPVLTVGRAPSRQRSVGLRCILCATDFSEDSLLAACYALSLALRHGARLILLTVIDEKPGQESKSSLGHRLSDLISNKSKPVPELEVLVASGDPAKKILEIASEHSVDIIALGVRGAGGFARAASHFGSTAHDIVVGSSCPVLTVHVSK